MTTQPPVTDEAIDAALAAGDVIEKVRREVAAVNAPEHRPGPSRMAARRVAPGLCLECGKPWPCPESWKARAEAAEAKLAAVRRLCQDPAAAVGTAMGGKHIPGDRVAAEVLAIIGSKEGADREAVL